MWDAKAFTPTWQVDKQKPKVCFLFMGQSRSKGYIRGKISEVMRLHFSQPSSEVTTKREILISTVESSCPSLVAFVSVKTSHKPGKLTLSIESSTAQSNVVSHPSNWEAKRGISSSSTLVDIFRKQSSVADWCSVMTLHWFAHTVLWETSFSPRKWWRVEEEKTYRL